MCVFEVMSGPHASRATRNERLSYKSNIWASKYEIEVAIDKRRAISFALVAQINRMSYSVRNRPSKTLLEKISATPAHHILILGHMSDLVHM